MSTKRILHVTYDMNIGGTEQVIRNLVEGLDQERFCSSILCIDGAVGPWGKELEAKGFRHFCLTRKPGFDFALILRIRKLIKDEAIDIVHCHQYTPYIYGLFGSALTGARIVFTEHGRFYPDVSSPKRMALNPLLQLGTHAITAISAATGKALEEFENFSASRISIIYNGIADNPQPRSDELKSTLGIPSNNIVLGTVSRLDPIKNQTMMLKSFKKCLTNTSNLTLLIVGDGPQKDELKALTETLGLSDSVIYTGFQPNPQAYLAIMDIFLLPSLSEGTSMTLLEAMSFSKPSIATAVGGTPEILSHAETGLLTENEDEAGLVDAINQLTNSSALREQYGATARKTYRERFSIGAMANQYQKLYDSFF